MYIWIAIAVLYVIDAMALILIFQGMWAAQGNAEGRQWADKMMAEYSRRPSPSVSKRSARKN